MDKPDSVIVSITRGGALRVYHLYVNTLVDLIDSILGRTADKTKKQHGNPNGVILYRVIAATGKVLGILWRLIPIPTPGLRLVFVVMLILSLYARLSSQPDSTFWIGTITFCCAVGFGLLAGSQFFARSLHGQIQSTIISAVDNGLYKWEPPVGETRDLRDFLNEENKWTEGTELSLTPRFIRPVIRLVCIGVVMIPWYPILTPHKAYACIIFYVVLTLDVLLRYFMSISLVSNWAWTIYKRVTELHENNRHMCPLCSHQATPKVTLNH